VSVTVGTGGPRRGVNDRNYGQREIRRKEGKHEPNNGAAVDVKRKVGWKK